MYEEGTAAANQSKAPTLALPRRTAAYRERESDARRRRAADRVTHPRLMLTGFSD